MSNKKVLIVDDDVSLLRVMEHHLDEAGFTVSTCKNGKEALEKQQVSPSQIIFTDINMPEMSGLEFLQSLREFDTKTIVIVITGFPTIEGAVDAMKSGAFDFIQKPVDKEHLLSVTRKASDYITLRIENERLRNLVTKHLDFGNMIGKSSAIQRIYNQARQVTNSNTTILIQGETGTGKEMLARAIHQNSPRKDKPFVAINCAAVPATLLESELFGHQKGSFTGAISDRKGLVEQAGEGTLFLDEIGDLPLELQPKLLRLLQDREFQPIGTNKIKLTMVRFIVATHHDLKEMVDNSTFREDLYFRLNVVPLYLPPMRERVEDIIPLFQYFLKEASLVEQKDLPSIDKAVIDQLEKYHWPGNVREIQNLAQRLMALHSSDKIEIYDLPESIFASVEEHGSNIVMPDAGFDLEEWTDKTILAALEKNNWNQSKTAQYLNISRNTLVYRIEKRPLLREAKQRLVNL